MLLWRSGDLSQIMYSHYFNTLYMLSVCECGGVVQYKLFTHPGKICSATSSTKTYSPQLWIFHVEDKHRSNIKCQKGCIILLGRECMRHVWCGMFFRFHTFLIRWLKNEESFTLSLMGSFLTISGWQCHNFTLNDLEKKRILQIKK